MIRLTEGEWAILEVLWSGERFPLGEIVSALRPKMNWRRNTVHTYLTRMESKGLVKIHRETEPHQYAAAVSREACAQQERKQLLDKVNSEVKEISGSVVYLDKSTKHMFELNNKVRLIDVREFMVENSSEFMGFICGIISQDRDLEKMYLDSFLTISGLEDDSDILPVVEKLDKISDAYHVDFVLSVSKDENELPDSLKSKIVVSL